MLKFLFGRKEATVKALTQRESFAQALSTLNALIDAQSPKPKITIDPATGHVDLILPEQLADEALALPAPVSVPEKKAEVKKDEKGAAAPTSKN